MTPPLITLFKKGIDDPYPYKDMPLDMFLNAIQEGEWEDMVTPVRIAKSKEEREALKKTLLNSTISGKFKYRSGPNLISHSGYICMDIDPEDQAEGFNPEDAKSDLQNDPYVYAAFVSCSGKGLAIIFQINPDKHLESWLSLDAYLFENYGLVSDKVAKDVTRARFVSYDPNIYINTSAKKFTKLTAPKAIKYAPVVFVQDDLSAMVDEVVRRGVNLCENYHEWRDIGFSLAHAVGEGGRQYFHALSSVSNKYSPDQCDRQYTQCLRSYGGSPITIATLYHHAKKAGIQPLSKQTQLIAQAAYQAKRSGAELEVAQQRVATLYTPSPDVVAQVYANNITPESDEPIISQVESWLKTNYTLKRNIVTGRIENNGVPQEDEDINSIWLEAKKIYDTKLPNNMLERIIRSRSTPDYDPLKDFILANQHRPNTDAIHNYCRCFTVDDIGYFEYWFKKWYVGIIESIFGDHSPLMLIYTGGMNAGKTDAFRRLLPDSLKPYVAKSRLDRGKDDEILMSQKILIYDDEMSGKSKKDTLHLKDISSTDKVDLRKPFGRENVTLKRRAVLCGTSNNDELLNDPFGERRQIPIRVYNIDFESIDKVDRTDMLIEAYHKWVSGEWTCRTTKDEIEMLNAGQGKYQSHSIEYEMIINRFTPDDNGIPLTASEIKTLLETSTHQRLTLNRIGMELKRLGIQQSVKRIGNSTVRVYMVRDNEKKLEAPKPIIPPTEENPF